MESHLEWGPGTKRAKKVTQRKMENIGISEIQIFSLKDRRLLLEPVSP
jgi:hypothetical protein